MTPERKAEILARIQILPKDDVELIRRVIEDRARYLEKIQPVMVMAWLWRDYGTSKVERECGKTIIDLLGNEICGETPPQTRTPS